MPLEPKAQLVDPQGPLDVDGVNATGITTATGGFVGQVQGSATGLAATTYNIQAGIITATRFIGDVTGTASSLAQGANITVGIMTATFVGDLVGNATGLTTTTSNLNLGIVTSTGFRGNFTGLSSGLSGTPNIQTGIVTATKFLGNSSGTVVDLADDTNINVGIITATKFEGNTTGSVTDLADDTNINVGIITASKFIGNANGSVTGLADDTNINVATFTGTEFKGNTPGTAADLKSGTNLTVGTFTGTKFIGNTPGSATKLADDVNVAASTFTGTKFVGNTPGTVSDIADDTNLNMGTLTGTKFIGNTTGSVSAISDDTNLNLGTLTASQFIGNTPGNAAGISAGKNLHAGAVVATTFYGDGSGLTGAGSTAYIRQSITASSSGAINLNLGNVVYVNHDADVTLSFSNVPTATNVTIIRSIADYTLTWPSGMKWINGSEPSLATNTNLRSNASQIFTLTTANGGTNWFGYEEVQTNPQTNKLFSWGANANGKLALNEGESSDRKSSPCQIPGTNWKSVTTGYGRGGIDHGHGIKTDGTLWGWGNNAKGQLGLNNRTKYSSPVQIGSDTNWATVSNAGEQITLAVKTDGTIWSWGSNPGSGPLGHNNRTSYSSPTQIAGRSYLTSELGFTGYNYWCAAIESGSDLWAWGNNSDGQLGQNNRTQYSSPRQIPGIYSSFSLMQSGSYHMGAVSSSGQLRTWGKNNTGQLGHNNRTSYSRPTQVPGTTWKQASGGYGGSAAVKTDGTLWTWGDNSQGQLGLNNRTQFSSPKQVPGTNWKNVRSQHMTRYAVRTDGTAWAWGLNEYGQLGLNNRTSYSSPTQIPGTSWNVINPMLDSALGLQVTP